MLVDSTSIPLRNLQSSPPASCHVAKGSFCEHWDCAEKSCLSDGCSNHLTIGRHVSLGSLRNYNGDGNENVTKWDLRAAVRKNRAKSEFSGET